MKQAIIYPLCYDNREILFYNDMIKDYIINAVIAPSEYGYDYKIDSEKTTSVITTDFTKQLLNSEAVIFVEGLEKYPVLYEEKISIAIQNDKTIVLSQNLYKLFKNTIESYKHIEIISEHDREATRICEEGVRNILGDLHKINIPIISIMGMGDYCNKFSCELALRKFFINKGYKVLQIGSKRLSHIFGFQSMPAFLMKNEYSIEQRAILFNRFICNLIDSYNPDLIILGIEGGILPANSKILNGLGELPYIIGNSVTVDVGVLGLYGNAFKQQLIDEYISCCKYRYNTPIMHLLESNTVFEFDMDNDMSKLKYYHLMDYEKIAAELRDKYSVFSVEESERAFGDILDLLTESLDIL